MEIKPVGRNILLSQDDNSDHSERGILLPGSLLERDQQGKVLAIGEVVTVCVPGEFVIFKAGRSQPVAGKLLVSQDDILALITQ